MKKEEENKKKETKTNNKTQKKKVETTKSNNKTQTKKAETTKVDKKTKKTKKEKKSNKFINIIKKKWLAQGTTTTLLVLAIICAFVAIAVFLQSLELSPIDLSQEKLFTLTEESKNKVKDINQDVHIYFIDSTDDDQNYELAKQFHNANEHINIEKIDSKERTDLAAQYEIESGSGQIIVASDKRYKKLTAYDLVSSDLMGQTSSIADKKLTNTILYVVAEEIPHAYILNGFSEFSSDRMSSFITLAGDSSVEIEPLNIITAGSIPENCSALIITTPSKDFDAQTTQAIMDYIQKGGNILWLNSLIAIKTDMPNVNKILAEYAIEPFEVGSIFETDADKMASGQPYVILPEVQGSKIATGLTGAGKAILLLNPTKINKASDDIIKNKNVTMTTILQASENSYFRTNLSNTNMTASSSDTKGPFDVGILAEKTLKEENQDEGTPALTSQMVVIGENYFASDLTMSTQQPVPFIYFANNADLAVNAISTLVDKEETVAPEKSTGAVSYSPTEQQNIVIITIISVVPVLIIIIGIVVWIVRRRKK